jgi:branched-chain amino acid transport system ATP-binding protein
MKTALSIIADEHRSLAAVLKGLQAHVGDARAGRVNPDFYLAGAMLDYIVAFPERLHHPKEDEYLFRFLRERSSEAHAILDTLEAQHVRGAELLADLRRRLEQSRTQGNFSSFVPALEAYAEFQWDHMRKEEEIVFPLAERHLTEEDWQTIDAAFRANVDRTW